MTTMTLAGNVKSALTHFALYGLARVCENAGMQKIRVRWTREAVPQAQLLAPQNEDEEIAEAVLTLVKQLAEEGQWPDIRVSYGTGKQEKEFSPFSPRIRGIQAEKNPDDWSRHQTSRHEALDKLTAERRLLDLMFLGSLGEAAYWRFDNKEPRPDHGASRWEMKTRNRGEEFVQDRFSKLCAELAQWDRAEVLDGLLGRAVNDSLGKNKADSRTSTGLTPPGPTDMALTFVALLGISAFPLAHQISRLSVTPGAYPVRSLHPQVMVLPVPVGEMTMARLQSVLVSQEFAQVLAHHGESLNGTTAGKSAGDAVDLEASYRWLQSRGVPGVAQFQVLKTGSSSAPERQVLQGRVVPHGH